MSRPILYGARQLADSMRAVRRNTMLIAEDIPEAELGFRATPVTRSVAETLVHIAWLGSSDRLLPGGGSTSRFEMLMATKEHELQHRAQLTVLERMLGLVPRFTGIA